MSELSLRIEASGIVRKGRGLPPWSLRLLQAFFVALPIGMALVGVAATMVTAFVSFYGWMFAEVAYRRRAEQITIAFGGSVRLPGRVSVDAESIVLELSSGKRYDLPRSEIADGWLETPIGGACPVLLRTKGGDVFIVETSLRSEAERLLVAAGLSPEQRVLSMRLSSSPWAGGFWPVPFVLLSVLLGLAFFWSSTSGIVGSASLLSLAGVCFFGLYAAAKRLVIPTVTVGVDGLLIQGFRRAELIPYAEVTGVDTDLHHVYLARCNAPFVVLPSWGIAREVLVTRIQEAMGAARESNLAEQELRRLDRAGRAIGVWREDLRGLGKEAGGGYRRISVGPEDLVRVVENPDNPVERRIAAALSVSTAGSGELSARIAAAAAACASPRLRVVLEQAAAGEVEEAAIEEALGDAKKGRDRSMA